MLKIEEFNSYMIWTYKIDINPCWNLSVLMINIDFFVSYFLFYFQKLKYVQKKVLKK